MPITTQDLKFRHAQRDTDNADGGGRMISAEVIDGQLNNLFPDIGDEERTTGRTVMRKLFLHVATPDTSVLKDAIAAITRQPVDPNVTVSAFSTGSYSDTRADAKNRLESYTTKGVESRFVLYGPHYQGTRTINVYAMQDAPTPDVGDNFCLSTTGAGYTANEQFVRVSKVLSRTTQTFYDGQNEAFQRDVLIIELLGPLLYEFHGQEVQRMTAAKPPTRIFTTNVSDATTHHGAKPLVLAAAPGDYKVNVGDPFQQLVPNTRSETPLTNLPAASGTISLVPSGDADSLAVSISGSPTVASPLVRYFGGAIARGSLKIPVGSVQLADDGLGGITGAAGWDGAVDYEAGEVRIWSETGASLNTSMTATPAGAVIDTGFTESVKVTSNNRTATWLFKALPLPAPGTARVEYRAVGKWRTLRDDAKGGLRGATGDGSGTANYQTGDVVATFGALPDIDTYVLLTYGTGAITHRRDGLVTAKPANIEFDLPNGSAKPSSLSISWPAGGSTVTATDNGSGVMQVGGVTVGSVNYVTRRVSIAPTTLPDGGSNLSYSYTARPQHAENFTPTADGNGVAAFGLTNGPVAPKSLDLRWLVTAREQDAEVVQAPIALVMLARDDGAGNVVLYSVGGKPYAGAIGSIDYATGAANVQLGNRMIEDVVRAVASLNTDRDGGSRLTFDEGFPVDVTTAFTNGSQVTASYADTSATETAASGVLPLPPVSLNVLPLLGEQVVPGSLRFNFRGKQFVDRGGSLYMDISAATGAGTFAGTVDYATGVASISAWAAGSGSNVVNVTSLLTRIDNPGSAYLDFRAPGAPLQPGQFTLSGAALDGSLISATADVNGVISGARVRGVVEWNSGFIMVDFGQMVAAAGHENEPWYDAGDVVGGQIWRPQLVDVGSLRFGVVVFQSIPLSEVVLGLDTTRLPADGRVLFAKSGLTLLVHHTDEEVVASPAAGQVVNFGRDRIYDIAVLDDAGEKVDSIWYTHNLDAGTLTFSDPLNLSAYALPIHVHHRVLDRALVAQVDLNGDVALNKPLTHAFPVGSIASAAIRVGEANGSLDVFARAENLFDQQTWDNQWLDARNGSAAAGTYNDVDYPIAVTNNDAITERWALVFKNATTVVVHGETIGQIAEVALTEDVAPINARTGQPYFTVLKEGWGGGWATNNVMRFNTVGGLAPAWLVRTTQPSEPTPFADGSRIEIFGNTTGV